MASKISKSKMRDQRNAKETETIKRERNIIKENVIKFLPSAEEISVDFEFKSVWFYVSNTDFNTKKSNYETENAYFSLEKSDKDMISLAYTYKLK